MTNGATLAVFGAGLETSMDNDGFFAAAGFEAKKDAKLGEGGGGAGSNRRIPNSSSS